MYKNGLHCFFHPLSKLPSHDRDVKVMFNILMFSLGKKACVLGSECLIIRYIRYRIRNSAEIAF